MKKYHFLFLFFVSLFINLFFFFYVADCSFYSGMIGTHGEIAYNIWSNNALLYNAERVDYISGLANVYKRRIEYNEINNSKFALSSPLYKGIVHTPFYGCLLGLLWKISNSLSYNDIIVLQIFLFSFCVLLVYLCALALFQNQHIAFFTAIAHLCFFPLIYLNVYPLRDIWVYYGLIIIIYGVVMYLFHNASLLLLFFCSVGFSFCHLIRPPLFASFLALSCILIFSALCKFISFKKSMSIVCVLVVTNITFFWIPFISYNVKAHNRLFVSSSGQTLLEGLGEISNKWGYECSDEWVALFMKKNFGLEAGTPECDDKAKELFFKAFKEEPLFYLKILMHRLRNLILPGLVWFSYVPDFEGVSLKEKIYRATYSWHAFCDLCGRQMYMRLYLLLGYLGIILLLIRRYYFLVILIFCSIIASSWWMLFVHLEHRYLIPYYSFFSFFVGYAVHEFQKIIALLFKKREKIVAV